MLLMGISASTIFFLVEVDHACSVPAGGVLVLQFACFLFGWLLLGRLCLLLDWWFPLCFGGCGGVLWVTLGVLGGDGGELSRPSDIQAPGFPPFLLSVPNTLQTSDYIQTPDYCTDIGLPYRYLTSDY